MLIESVSSTAKRAEELLNTANESKTSLQTPFQVENHFTGLYNSYYYYYYFLKMHNFRASIVFYPKLLLDALLIPELLICL